MNAIVGCDPGLDGALALTVHGIGLDVIDMPILERPGKTKLAFDKDGVPEERHGRIRDVALSAVREHLLLWREKHAASWFVMEMPGPRPEQGIATTAKSMMNAGLVLGIAIGLGYRHLLVAPAAWKSVMAVTADKDTSRARAAALAPGLADRLLRKKDHGRAEAILIALHGERKIK